MSGVLLAAIVASLVITLVGYVVSVGDTATKRAIVSPPCGGGSGACSR